MPERNQTIRKFRSRELQAVAVLLWERMLAAFWRLLAWIAAFMGLWLLDLPILTQQPFDTVLLVLFGLGVFWFLIAAYKDFRFPKKIEVRRRLEEDSRLLHRPLASMDDNLANPQKETTKRLWGLRDSRLEELLENLRPPLPRPQLPARDPYALRYLAIFILLAGVIVAGPRAPSRLAEKFRINLPSVEKEEKDERVIIRINPPEYTGLGETLVREFAELREPVTIVEGSNIKIRAVGGLGVPKLNIGDMSLPFKSAGEGVYILNTPAFPGENLKISQMFLTIAELPFIYKTDTPPEISMEEDASILGDGKIKIPLRLKDDFGVRNLRVTLNLDEDVSEAAPVIGKTVQENRLVMTPGGKEMQISPVYDFTSHTWAGLPVKLTFEAIDSKGQTSRYTAPSTVLPERQFKNPVSQVLIELRRQLAWTPESSIPDVAMALENLLMAPGIFEEDYVAFLSIRTAASRLEYAPRRESVEAIIALLWDIAVRLDGGSLSLARRDLADTQQALEEALSDPEATEEEIARLMQDLRQALAGYMYQLAREMAEKGEIPVLDAKDLAGTMDTQTLSAVLDKLQSMAMSGERLDAQERLSQIRRMTDALDSAEMTELPPDIQFMERGEGELEKLAKKQKELLQQTQRQAQVVERSKKQRFGEWLPPGPIELGKMPPPPVRSESPDLDFRGAHTAQEALRFALGQLMREAAEILDDIPEGMGLAEQQMRGSSLRLDQSRPKHSIPHQEKAIEHLQEASQKISEKLSQRMKQIMALSMSGGLDPLGRPLEKGGNRKFFDTEVKIPDASQRKKMEEILRILRPRSGELSRPGE